MDWRAARSKMPRGLTERVGEQAVLGYTRRGGRIGEVDLCSDGAQSRSETGVGRKSHGLLGNTREPLHVHE